MPWRNACLVMVQFCRVSIANEQWPVYEESGILNAHVLLVLGDSVW